MSNRHARRADLRAFKREAHREHLLTYLIDADDDVSLNSFPLLSRAVSFWRATSRIEDQFALHANRALPMVRSPARISLRR
jgi:hypothetical protein